MSICKYIYIHMITGQGSIKGKSSVDGMLEVYTIMV